jgi:phosphoribosylformylglycinamidine synthase PurS subunit
MKVRVLIKKKEGVLDIEGKAIGNALLNLKMEGFESLAKGTFVEFDFNGKADEVENFVKNACQNLLVNDVIESYEYQVL